MHLSATSRPARVRRVLAISAAAVAVMIAPTACDYGGFGAGSSSADTMGDMPGMDHGGHDERQPVVVPVGNTVESTYDRYAHDTDEEDRGEERQGDRRSREDDRDSWKARYVNQPAPTTATIPPPAGSGSGTDTGTGSGTGNDTGTGNGTGTDTAVADPTATAGETAAPTGTVAPVETVAPTDTAAPTATAPATAAPVNNGLDVLGRDCTNSNLAPHDGFQKSPACVSTAMGEVAAEDKLPSLLITDAPDSVGVNQPFTLEISTRNLVRDRFLGAAAGGYYLESSFLDGAGLQRGHFHTACRILASGTEAPDSSKTPEFFLATQDNGGGAAPDTVTIEVPGIKTAGQLQCTSWAGDGSHRTPMMTRANQTPAIDSVRITVAGNAPAEGYDPAAAQQDAAAQAEAQQQEANQQAPDQDGAIQPGADAGLPSATEAPAAEAPASEAPAAETSAASTSSATSEN